MRFVFFIGGFMALTLGIDPALSKVVQPYGIWSMGKVTIKVTECRGELCVTIVGLKEPISKVDGKPKVDRQNPDPAKRKRPLIGLSLLRGMSHVGDSRWKGAIYNPDDGKTYSANIMVVGNTMKVQGCIGGIFCKGNNLVRVK